MNHISLYKIRKKISVEEAVDVNVRNYVNTNLSFTIRNNIPLQINYNTWELKKRLK